MPSFHPDLPETSDKTDAAPRLVGWKDIAAYLGKADRTVKRWGRDRGLPVHRVPGTAKTSVYAYPAELDLWLELAKAEPDLDDEEAESVVAVAPPVAAMAAPATEPVPAAPLQRRGLAAWSIKRKWATALAAVVVVAVAFDVASRLAIGASAASTAGRMFAHRAPAAAGSPPAASHAEKGEADDFYLRGRYEWNQRTPESLNLALDLFTQAIVHDPSDARAYAGLADTYNLLREYSTTKDDDAFSRAIAAARKAVALDDSLSEAHRALAYDEMYASWDFADADKEFHRAIELNPNDAQARLWYANAFGIIGRFPEALEQMDKAQELNPSSPSTLADKGLLLYLAGHTQEGIDLLKEVERSAPNFRSPHQYLMGIDLEHDDYAGFLAEGELSAQSSNDPALKDIIDSARAGYAHGSRGLLNALYGKEKEYYAEGRLHGTTFAGTCVLMGRKQEALGILEDAYSRHDAEVFALLSSPTLLMLKDEPRYKTLARRINFPRSTPATAQNLAAAGFASQ